MSEATRLRLVRAAGLAAVLVFGVLVARFWHPVYGFTAFFQIDAPNDELKITAFRELPVYVHRDTGGYDGLYYAQIAHDPALRDPELPRAMDNFPYRARRILPPALGWLFGFGQPVGIIFAYSVLNMAVWLAFAWLLWRVLEVRDLRSWIAWFGVMFSAGALSSVRLALTDLTALFLIVAGVWAAERWRGKFAVGTLATAALARETALIGVASLIKPPWFSAKNVARVGLVAVPLAAWLAYVRWRLGAADQGWANFTWPIAGFLEKWRDTLAAAVTVADKPLAFTTLLATLALTVQAAFVLAQPRLEDRWWRLGAVFAGMMFFLGTAVWEGFPGAATRVLLPLSVAFNVLAVRRRAHLAWLLAGNLTVCAGFVALRDAPRDPGELAAAHERGTACIVRVGDGWHGREASRSHVWFWTAAGGSVRLETWPKRRARVELEFGVRSLQPRSVIVRQGGQEVARVEVGAKLTTASVPLEITGGATEIEFLTDTPGQRESPAPNARELAFALYDLRVRVAKP